MYDKHTKSFIDNFRINGKRYEHNLFYMDDDRIECIDEVGEVVLTYTADSYVFDKDKKQLGKFCMTVGDKWCFKPADGGHRINFEQRTIIAAEVEFSKMYLRGEL